MVVPARTCIGCRRVAGSTELVRIVVIDGRLRVGPRGGQAGRGASIHPREACVLNAVKKHAFTRAFRMPLLEPSGPDAVQALVRDLEVAHLSQQSENGRTS